jgi:hypothetical protein
VVVARTVDEALRHLGPASGPLHLLLSDLILPGADAGDLARRVIEQRPALPVLFVTGHAPEDVVLSHPHLSGRRLLQKPVPPPLLLSAIRQLLDGIGEADRRLLTKTG